MQSIKVAILPWMHQLMLLKVNKMSPELFLKNKINLLMHFEGREQVIRLLEQNGAEYKGKIIFLIIRLNVYLICFHGFFNLHIYSRHCALQESCRKR